MLRFRITIAVICGVLRCRSPVPWLRTTPAARRRRPALPAGLTAGEFFGAHARGAADPKALGQSTMVWTTRPGASSNVGAGVAAKEGHPSLYADRRGFRQSPRT